MKIIRRIAVERVRETRILVSRDVASSTCPLCGSIYRATGNDEWILPETSGCSKDVVIPELNVEEINDEDI
jgi:hypothetical protein